VTPAALTSELRQETLPAGTAGLRTVDDLRGPAGRLEALLNPGLNPKMDPGFGITAPPLAVLLCHPHPLHGGTLHNKVVYRAMKVFIGLGLPVLRFNFRGTGRSEGSHDAGRGEQDDVRAGLDWLDREFGLPLLAAGFSFGSNMALRAGCVDPRVQGLVALGAPVEAAGRRYSYDFLAQSTQPKLFLNGTEDIYSPHALLEQMLLSVPEPRQVAWIADADHFFVGRLGEMQAALRTWMQAQFPVLRREAEIAR
jgi:alpha/beta superfamily hydrolase